MPIVYIFGVIPICLHMLYLIYVALFLISAVLLVIFSQDPHKNEKQRLAKLITRKQNDRAEQFKKLRAQLKTEEDNHERIVALSFEELRVELESGRISATDTLNAYVWKALVVTEELNCVTEFNENAWELAGKFDERFRTEGTVSRPLHGIPFCVKDDYDIEGMDTTLGYAKNLYKPAQETSLLVKALVELGAVPFCKTNLPQTTFSNGSHNPVYGATKNCIRASLSPAGSSSGTASLIGAHGALFGLGSDLGGSVRTPAHNCGISSIRPTIGRLSAKGIKAALPTIGVTPVPGIMAREPGTLASLFQWLARNELPHKLNSTWCRLGWSENLFSAAAKLRIGYFNSLQFYPAIGDSPETVMKAVDTLQTLGHSTVEFEMPDSIEMSQLFLDICLADGGEMLRESLKEEPEVSSDFTETWPDICKPEWKRWLKRLSDRILLKIGREDVSARKLWLAWERRNQLRNQVLDRMRAQNVSAIICPVFAFPAVKPEDNRKLMCASYTMVWSLLDFPVAVTRFGVESGSRLQNDPSNNPMFQLGLEVAKNSIGMPIGIQIASRPFEEEVCLKLAVILDSLKDND